MIRKAAPGDCESLVRLARQFTEHSGLPLTFNEERARETIWHYINHPDIDVLVDDEVTCLACVTYEVSYYDELCAYVDKFYVGKPSFAGGSLLARAVVEHAEVRGAKLIFAIAGAQFGERSERFFVRLFERHGFRILGRTLMRARWDS